MELHNFYCFVFIKNIHELQGRLQRRGVELEILGTILIAQEGINAALFGKKDSIARMLSFLENEIDVSMNSFITHFTDNEVPPFHKFKVRLKPEIVALGMPSLNPSDQSCAVGTYVDPWQWNEIIQDENTILLDTRNTYEYCVGHFKNAINPDISVFKEFPEYIERRFADEKARKHIVIAMYCTGGIRCEKASALLKNVNFDSVYQLKGGILEYFKTIPKNQSLWKGGCFVFDDRVVIDHSMNPLPIEFDDIPEVLRNYRETSGHANHIYRKIINPTQAFIG